MLYLGIDSSTMVGSVALLSDSSLIGEYTLNLKRTHSERLMLAIEHLLDTAEVSIRDIDVICTAVGPGSYTGVRIGVTTAKVLAWANAKPLVGVGTLEAMARSAEGMGPGVIAVPMIAAKGTLVFAGAFDVSQGYAPVIDGQPIGVDELVQRLSALDGRLVPLGDGFLQHEGQFSALDDAGRVVRLPSHRLLPRASNVADLGRIGFLQGISTDPGILAPTYLRETEAEVAWARKQKGV